jgi:hypothetical protein
MAPDIDLVVLSRDKSALAGEVDRGIAAQTDSRLTIHRVIGRARPSDANRWTTIARARNEGKSQGHSEWVMFLDDDVALSPGCVRRLWEDLQRRPAYGALAADYLGQSNFVEKARHVSMGATLFRRAALRDIHFRWRPGRCECQCCCDDLRRNGYGIDYLPAARARHLEIDDPERCAERAISHGPAGEHAPAIGRSVQPALDRYEVSPQVFESFFRSSIRPAFDWKRFASEAWPVTVRVFQERSSLAAIDCAWNSVPALDIPKVLSHFPPRRRRLIRQLADQFRESQSPIELVVPALATAKNRYVLLDGNHRVGALMLSDVPFRLLAFIVHGPARSRDCGSRPVRAGSIRR